MWVLRGQQGYWEHWGLQGCVGAIGGVRVHQGCIWGLAGVGAQEQAGV